MSSIRAASSLFVLISETAIDLQDLELCVQIKENGEELAARIRSR